MIRNLKAYNAWKRSTLDRVTGKYKAKMVEVLNKHTNAIGPQMRSALEARRLTFNMPDLFLKHDLMVIMLAHQHDCVYVGISDGIREMSPKKKLSTWERYPYHFPVEETFTNLADRKVRDGIAAKAFRSIRRRNLKFMSDILESEIDRYKRNIKSVFENIAAKYFLDPENEDPKSVFTNVISRIFDKSESQSEMIFRTETTRYFNDARVAYFQENTDVDFVQIIAVTDGRISNICESREGYVIPIARAGEKQFKPPFHPNCYDDQTEVYTDKGWQSFSGVVVGQNALSLDPKSRDLEWVKISDKQVYPHSGEIVHISNNQHSLDLAVTPEHTMFYFKRKDDGRMEPTFKPVAEFLKNMKGDNWLYLSSKWVGREMDAIDMNGLALTPKQFCRFMAFYLSDGSTSHGSLNTRYVHIAQMIGQDVMFDELVQYPFKNVTRTKDKIHIYDSRAGHFCHPFGKSAEKFVPEIIKQMTPENIRHFLDAYNQCDGSIAKPSSFKGAEFKPSKNYFTTSKRMADDLTELLIKAGAACSTHIQPNKGKVIKFRNGEYAGNHDMTVITELTSIYRSAKKVERKDYDGMVYDLTLDKFHTLLVRRNGKIAWNSNCRSVQSPLDTDLKSDQEEVRKNLGNEFGKVHSSTSDLDFTGRRAKPAIPLPKGWG